MPARPFWKGYLKLSLVTCPVAMTPAISEGEKVRFHVLNRATGDRVESVYVDAETGKRVDSDDQVKGYPRDNDSYVTLEDDELDAVALESARIIDIETFVPRDSIDWIWCDRPHYLAPNDKVGEQAFSVIREAMAVTGMAGISRVVLYRRERAVLLEPRDRGIVLWTLRYGDEVRESSEYFGGIGHEKADPKFSALVKTLIEERTKDWSPKLAQDPVQAHLLEIIAAKKKGNPKAKAKTPAKHAGNVVDIMDALRKSLASDGKRSKKE